MLISTRERFPADLHVISALITAEPASDKTAEYVSSARLLDDGLQMHRPPRHDSPFEGDSGIGFTSLGLELGNSRDEKKRKR